MQLNAAPIREALALAGLALVHGTACADKGDWKLAGELLSYEEKSRVSVFATALNATRDLGEEQSFTVRGVYDSLSGASPNGATPTTTAQTFTGASGQGSYTTPARALPLKEFSDSRTAFGVDYVTRTGPTSGRTLTADISSETDYLSTGGSATWTTEVNNKLTTLAWGLGGSYDLVQPKGFPTPLASIQAVTTTCASGATGAAPAEGEEERDGREGDDGCGESDGKQKTTLNLLAGITQVLGRRTLGQLNYTASRSEGYLTDPYKIISVVDPTSGATIDYKYEKRPPDRFANGLFAKIVHHFDRDVLHLSHRYFTDDWGITAQTTELQYRFMLGERVYLEPQYRYHVQSAADFFHHSLTTTQSVRFASADLRLGAMTSTRAGLKLGLGIGKGELTLRYSTMTQTGDSHPADAIGVQREVDLYPELDVTIWNLGFVMPL